MGHRQRSRGAGALRLLTVSALLIGCADTRPADESSAATVDGASTSPQVPTRPPTPPPAPTPPAPPAPSAPSAPPASRAPVESRVRRDLVAGLDLSAVRIAEGWSPLGLFGSDPVSWEDDLERLPDLIAPRAVPGVRDGAFAERAEVRRDPAPCFAFERRVLGVGVDVPGEPGRAVERALMAEVARWDRVVAEAAGQRGADGSSWCRSAFGGRRVGFHVVEVHPEACALPVATGPVDAPPAREVVCHTVGAFGYLLGSRDTWTATHLVHDVATGERLGTADLLPRVDPGLLDAVVDRIVREVPPSNGLPAGVELALDVAVADPLPTAEGMRWRWSPLSNRAGGVEVLVPWAVLADLAGPDWDAVDLAARTWTTACTPDGAPRSIALSDAPAGTQLIEPVVPGGRVIGRRLGPGVDAMAYSVDLSRRTRVDVDLDGRSELVVRAACFLGNGWYDTLEVWRVGPDGVPVQLPTALRADKTEGYVTDLTAGPGTLLVTMRVGAPGDPVPHLNGYPRVRVLELWTADGEWRSRVITERDAADG